MQFILNREETADGEKQRELANFNHKMYEIERSIDPFFTLWGFAK